MAAFWQQALHYVPREPASKDWAVIRDPWDKGPNLSFQRRDRPAMHRSWLHLDLYTSRPGREVERLVALGARRATWHYPEHADYVVMEDPDGNLFCVVQKEDQPQSGENPVRRPQTRSPPRKG